MKVFSRFCLAAAYVTRLPLAKIPENPHALSGLSKYLSSVGLMIGLILAAGSTLIDTLPVTGTLKGILLALSWLALTGGLHFDGLMDTADGIFSHRSRERMLEIMSDSRVGNFGAMTGFAVMLVKVGALAALSHPVLLCALILVPAWARWCETFAIGYFPYAKEQGMGKIWHESTVFPGDIITAAILPAITTIACLLFASSGHPALAALLTIMSGAGAAFYLASILKGHTGDTYGATVELAEAGGLLILACLPF